MGYMTEERKQKATAAFGLLLALPADIWADLCTTTLQIQCTTQAEVQQARALFGGGIVWKKEYDAELNWWRYTAEIAGADVLIYGCSEAPAACRIVEETYDVTEKVPVAYEERTVTKTRLRAECPDTMKDVTV